MQYARSISVLLWLSNAHKVVPHALTAAELAESQRAINMTICESLDYHNVYNRVLQWRDSHTVHRTYIG